MRPFLLFSLRRLALGLATLAACAHVHAWGPDGHHTVGALADQLIAGTPAAAQVAQLLGSLSLQQAAVWADCAKGIDPKQSYAYTSAGKYPECKPFETPEGEAEMADFVRRNDTNCNRKPTEESCHKQYHYTDVAVQRSAYKLGSVGTRSDDIVGAVVAATQVLRGQPAPAPFDIKSPREALLLLAHYAGDIHQPLHVGAVYLDAKGKRVDPDATGLNPATETRGGNQIITLVGAAQKPGPNLHAVWDDTPAVLHVTHLTPAWVAQARAVAVTPGAVDAWPAIWATGTVVQAKTALIGRAYRPKQGTTWTVALPASYPATMTTIKRRQLTLAGARLAQVLRSVWP
jgi:hypothetical protein